jgi:1,4-dihydroxy-6-naphthoate synthase
MRISLGISTCPNDTFMFDAMVNHRIDTGGITFDLWMGDILHLNQKALAGELDMVKISYATYARVRETYSLLRAGSAMGRGCGPLLLSRQPITADELFAGNPLIAVPGLNTTANHLLRFFAPQGFRPKEMIFHEVMPALQRGEVDAGVIIHENRFTYPQYGLHKVQDLGEFWEAKTGLPIPLGAIVAHHRLGADLIGQLDRLMRASVEFAFANPLASKEFVALHAQEMDAAVCQLHIDLYVNEFSVDMGEEGSKAVETLLASISGS